ncbi:MAG: D-alanyl-D-alanine carboxypeptidase [Selenomonadaceae bacterium]|nr:D-alanyl-D-alanine carboxypeptidase [Selenomonadaceae bacterium]
MRNSGNRILALVWMAVLFLCEPSLAESAPGVGEAPVITATSAILIEASTGRVVYEKNADEVRPPASMTKMMTCILGLENMGVRALITISPNAAMTEDSALGLQPGNQVDAQNLLLGMMMVSDNAAAVAVAEHIDGTVQGFAARMNEKAGEIGCTDTHFANPNGLPNPAHLSTARDMAQIAAYCMRNKEFRSIVGERQASMRWESPRGKFLGMENTNELLGTYEGITGIKTGWTIAAGGCLAASARRNGVELIAVVMNSADTKVRFQDAQKLLDYGFSHVKLQRVVAKERMSKNLWVKGGANYRVEAGPATDISYPLLHDETAKDYSLEYRIPAVVKAPVKKGQVVGQIVVKYKGKETGKIDVTARQNVASGFSFLSYFFVGLMSYFMG